MPIWETVEGSLILFDTSTYCLWHYKRKRRQKWPKSWSHKNWMNSNWIFVEGKRCSPVRVKMNDNFLLVLHWFERKTLQSMKMNTEVVEKRLFFVYFAHKNISFSIFFFFFFFLIIHSEFSLDDHRLTNGNADRITISNRFFCLVLFSPFRRE